MQTIKGLDRGGVIELGHAIFAAIDERDWVGVKKYFAPRLMVNMAENAGGEPEQVSPDELFSGWRKSLDLPVGLHHQVGNHRVVFRDDGADLHCSILSIHYYEGFPPQTKMFVGNYTLGFGLNHAAGEPALLVEFFSYRHSFKIDAGTFLEGTVQ